MRGKLAVLLACGACPMIMASDIGLTSTRIYSAISEECSRKQKQNFVFSPFSILGVFHMAQIGAEGETKNQMDTLVPSDASFTLPSFDVTSVDGKKVVQVQTANRIYTHKALEGNEYFNNFGSEVRLAMNSDARTIDFGYSEGAAEEINEFVKETTHGHITDLIDPSMLSASTKMVLVNAIYFKAPWGDQFPAELTKEGVFHAVTTSGLEEQRVQFMHNKFDSGFTYIKEEGVTAFTLSYADPRLSMYVYMPGDMMTFEKKISEHPEYLEDLAARLGTAHIMEDLVLTFPKFKLSAGDNSVDLADIFKKLGADRMFDARLADFSGITGDRDLFVSSYVHQADISVDEEGTEATAATSMGIVTLSMPMANQRIRLTVDKPFMFQLRFLGEGGESAVLFAGRITDPKSAQ